MVPNSQLCGIFSVSLYEHYSSFTASLYPRIMGSTGSGRNNFIDNLAEPEGARAPHDVGSRTRDIRERRSLGQGGTRVSHSVRRIRMSSTISSGLLKDFTNLTRFAWPADSDTPDSEADEGVEDSDMPSDTLRIERSDAGSHARTVRTAGPIVIERLGEGS
ncbi:hypothetical protein EDD15DRAFT_2364379 [Pisolithus albus]|nr:hypothetical protein EDD15DRAFT_2364379 [Pisolithus albus]